MNGQIIIGNVDWMRNDYVSDVSIDGITYPSVEHAFQASKFHDRDVREDIAEAEDVKAARRIGRGRGDIRPDWDNVKTKIMELLIRQKFTQDSELASRLAKTGTSEIIMSGYDDFWGTGRDGSGQNYLGQIMSNVRSEVQTITGIIGTESDEDEIDGIVSDQPAFSPLKAVLSNEPSEEILDACQQMYDGALALMTLVDKNDYDAGLIARRTGMLLSKVQDAVSKLQNMQEAVSFISDKLGDGAINIFGIQDEEDEDVGFLTRPSDSEDEDWFSMV